MGWVLQTYNIITRFHSPNIRYLWGTCYSHLWAAGVQEDARLNELLESTASLAFLLQVAVANSGNEAIRL